MHKTKFAPEKMPILDLEISTTNRYEANCYLDSSQVMASYLDESSRHGEVATAHALCEIAKARARLKQLAL